MARNNNSHGLVPTLAHKRAVEILDPKNTNPESWGGRAGTRWSVELGRAFARAWKNAPRRSHALWFKGMEWMLRFFQPSDFLWFLSAWLKEVPADFEWFLPHHQAARASGPLAELLAEGLSTRRGRRAAQLEDGPGSPVERIGIAPLRQIFEDLLSSDWTVMELPGRSFRHPVRFVLSPPDCLLNTSQQLAVCIIREQARLRAGGNVSRGGVKIRTHVCLVGPSGSGKTHVVSEAAKRMQLPVFAINAQNWIVRGASYKEGVTWEAIQKFVKKNPAGIILIDELNKLNMTHAAQSAWVADVFSELLALLDADAKLLQYGFSGEQLTKLRRSFMVVGAAAFQDLWSTHQRAGISFSGVTLEGMSYVDRIRSQSVVPEELLNRFSDQLLLIDPPTEEEFSRGIRKVRANCRLPALSAKETARLAKEAAASGRHMRWLETYLAGVVHDTPSWWPADAPEDLGNQTSVRAGSPDSLKSFAYMAMAMDRLVEAATRLSVALAADRQAWREVGQRYRASGGRRPLDRAVYGWARAAVLLLKPCIFGNSKLLPKHEAEFFDSERSALLYQKLKELAVQGVAVHLVDPLAQTLSAWLAVTIERRNSLALGEEGSYDHRPWPKTEP